MINQFRFIQVLLFMVGSGFVTSAVHAQDEQAPSISDALFVEFAPMTVAVIRDKRIRGHLTVTFFLAVGTQPDIDRIDAIRPKLRDAVLQNLARIGNARVDPNLPVDLDLVADYLQYAVDDILGKDVAKVLLQSASTQVM